MAISPMVPLPAAPITLDLETLLEEFADRDIDLAAAEGARQGNPLAAFKPPPQPPAWKAHLSSIHTTAAAPSAQESRWPDNTEILYLLDIAKT